jgi:hypothetical protein
MHSDSSLLGLTRLRGPKPYEQKYQPLLRRAKARQSIPLAFSACGDVTAWMPGSSPGMTIQSGWILL